jgi:hypothetical protein
VAVDDLAEVARLEISSEGRHATGSYRPPDGRRRAAPRAPYGSSRTQRKPTCVWRAFGGYPMR